MSWTPAVPPPPVAGAATGTGVGDGLGEGLGEPITGDVADVVTAVAGVVTGNVVVCAAEVLEPGPSAVTALPPGDAGVLEEVVAPPAAVHAVAAARTVRAPQPIAASLARPPDAR
jgi:hypothetical protein